MFAEPVQDILVPEVENPDGISPSQHTPSTSNQKAYLLQKNETDTDGITGAQMLPE